MSAAPTPDEVGSLLRPAGGALGLDVEEVRVASAVGRRLLRIAVDKDGGVSLDDVAEATKAFSAALDSSDVMGEQPYVLEVTSPGLDRPLTAPRHWIRNLGRLVQVVGTDGATTIGRIKDADQDRARLIVAGAGRDIRYADVATARVQVEFNRKDS